ncbi:hypothetical protein AKJ16_DCAP10954 [Drosera capensis]
MFFIFSKSVEEKRCGNGNAWISSAAKIQTVLRKSPWDEISHRLGNGEGRMLDRASAGVRNVILHRIEIIFCPTAVAGTAYEK